MLDAGRQRGVVVDPSSGEGGDEVCFDVRGVMCGWRRWWVRVGWWRLMG